MKFWNPIESQEQAEKAIKNSILGLLGFAVLQAGIGLFFWWLTIQSTPNPLGFALTVTAIVFVALSIALYFSNSPIMGGVLLLAIIFEAISWLNRGTATGDFSIHGVQIIMIIVLVQALATVLRVLEWKKKEGSTKLNRSKIIPVAISITSILVIAGFVVPVSHFWYHTRKEVSVVEMGRLVHYVEPLDMYSIDFPNTWKFEQPPLEYGNVRLNPTDNDSAYVLIERWTPWSIPAVQLFSEEAFLSMANEEANSYSNDTGATIESVAMIPDPKINKAEAVFTGIDGTKRIMHYIYNRAWSRQTSESAWFFWRITAEIPPDSLKYQRDVEDILSSFSVDPTLVK